MKKNNFVKLKSLFSLFNNLYAYVDTKDYLADQLFINEKMRVNFNRGEFRRGNEKYVIIMCKIRKKDKAKFEAVMEKLKTKMLLLDNNDYMEYCENLWNEMDSILDK